jgi:hypothetical protein
MVLFGRPKGRRRLAFGVNHSRVLCRFLLESFSSRRFLFRPMVIHTCSILSSVISPLAILSGWVDSVEKGVQQLFVSYLGGIVVDHDCFGMTSVPRTDLIIGGKVVVLWTLCISYRCVDHAWNSLVRQFQSPCHRIVRLLVRWLTSIRMIRMLCCSSVTHQKQPPPKVASCKLGSLIECVVTCLFCAKVASSGPGCCNES